MTSWLDSLLNSDRIFIYILRAIGIILAAIGYGSVISTVVFLLRSKRAHGKLVEWERFDPPVSSLRPNARPTYRAVVTYTTVDGSEHRVTGGVRTSRQGKPPLPLGHAMPVRYIPSRPDDARITTLVNLWFMPLICSLIGSFLLYLWLH